MSEKHSFRKLQVFDKRASFSAIDSLLLAWIVHQESRIKNQESRIKNQESSMIQYFIETMPLYEIFFSVDLTSNQVLDPRNANQRRDCSLIVHKQAQATLS